MKPYSNWGLIWPGENETQETVLMTKLEEGWWGQKEEGSEKYFIIHNNNFSSVQ